MRNTVLAILLSLVAGLAGVWIGKSLLIANESEPPDLHEEIHTSLNLTAEQLREFYVLEESFAKRKQELENRLKAANGSLADAIQKDHEFSEKVTQAGAEYMEVLSELQKETLQHIFKMRAVLTADQVEEFDEIVIRSLHAATN